MRMTVDGDRQNIQALIKDILPVVAVMWVDIRDGDISGAAQKLDGNRFRVCPSGVVMWILRIRNRVTDLLSHPF